jgi:hypothetical protein
MSKTFQDIDMGNAFQNRTPIAQEIRTKIGKWDTIKFKSFGISKKTILKMNMHSAQK